MSVDKLRAVRAPGPSVLSLYMWVPADLPALRGLPARADELVAGAVGGTGGGQAARARTAERHIVRRLMEANARAWLGHTVAMFACAQTGLAEAVPLPCELPDRAVLAARPHLRPLLAASQRHPPYQVVVVDRQHAWVFRIADTRIDVMALPGAKGLRSHRFGGWYGLESHRVSARITGLARYHWRETAAVLRDVLPATGPLVAGGHKDSIPLFLAELPTEIQDRFIGSMAVDPGSMTPARVRELSAPVVGNWVRAREEQLAARVTAARSGGHAATGARSCLAAVNAQAVAALIVPDGDMVPGFACDQCGMLASAPGQCPHRWPSAHPVPDLLEEMVTATVAGGGEVTAVHDPPGGVAALLRFPLALPAAS